MKEKKKKDKPKVDPKPWYGLPSLVRDLEKRKADLDKAAKK